MRPVIHSQKHYVQISRSTVLTVAATTIDLVLARAAPTGVDEVIEGAVVKAVFVELWLLNSSNDGSDIVTVQKSSSTAVAPTFANMNALDAYALKKNILFTHQGLSSNNGVGNPVQVLNGWIKIPKSKQRFGLGDELILNIANNGPSTLEFCGFATYKEYT